MVMSFVPSVQHVVAKKMFSYGVLNGDVRAWCPVGGTSLIFSMPLVKM